jgi:CRP-like cAMP-binding protein
MNKYVGFLKGVRFGTQSLGDLFPRRKLEQIASALEREAFAQGDHIIRQGQEGDHFYLVEEGEVGVYKEDDPEAAAKDSKSKLAVLSAGAYFGEKALLAGDKRQASCVAETDVKCLTLNREDFSMMLGSLDYLLSDSAKAGGPPLARQASELLSVQSSEAFSLETLESVAIVGQGAYGVVRLMKAADGRALAVKCMSKQAIVEKGVQEHVMRERAIVMRIDHPFICKMFVHDSLRYKINIK